MTTHQALNPKSDVARIYLSRKVGGRGLISAEDTIKLATLELERYKLLKGLLIAARRRLETTSGNDWGGGGERGEG